MVVMGWEGSSPWSFSGSMSVEVFNVGGWLTHGDLALETNVDFLAVVEHRLVPARVRGEWARLRSRGASSVWSPASQESSHVGHGGVGVVSLKGAPLSLPASATAQFRRFFDCGRALRCVLPIASGRFCTWLSCTVIMVRIGMLSNFRLLTSCLMLLWGSLGCCVGSALSYCWGFQRGAHQSPLSV